MKKTTTMKKTTNTLALLAGASLVCSASLQAANVIVNGDFATSSAGNNTVFVDPFGKWTNSGTQYYHYNDNELGSGNYVYLWPGPASLDQDVSAAWTTSHTIDISLITAMTSWGGEIGSVLVELRKASDDSVLWSNTTGGINNAPTTVIPLSWSIDAGTLAATPGEDLNLRITGTGTGVAIDNVSLEFNAIPEPSSAALLGLCGLALLRRRRN